MPGPARTIGIRLTLEEADKFQSIMKTTGAGAQSELKAIAASAETASGSLGKVAGAVTGFGKAANDGGASVVSLTGKIDAARLAYAALATAAGQAAAAEAAAASNRAAVAAAQARQSANQYAGAGYSARAGDLEAAFAAADKLRASLVPLAAAEQQHAAQLAKIAAAEKSGVITANEAAAARATAAKTFAGQTSALNDNAKAHQSVTQAGKLANYQMIEIAETAHKFADQVISGGSAVKGLAYELPNAIAIAGGFSNALAAIGRNIPLIGLAATAAGLVALGLSAESNETRLRSLGQQARATRDDFGSYAKTLDDAARDVAAHTTLSTKDARSTVNSIGLDANFAGNSDDLKRLAIDAQNLATVLKTDLAGGTKIVTDGLDNAAKAAKDLQEKGFAGFTPELVRTVELLQQSGKPGEAFALVLQKIEERTKGAATDALTPLGIALRRLNEDFNSSKDASKSWSDTIGHALETAAANGVTNMARLVEALGRGKAAIEDAFSRPPQTEFGKVTPFAVSSGRNVPYGPYAPPGMFTSAPTPAPGTGAGPSVSTNSPSKEAFVSNWLDAAKAAGQQLGISPQVLLGHWGQETGWGSHLHDYNPGNLTAGAGYTGSTVTRGDTTASGQSYQTQFRAYQNPMEFSNDFVNFMHSPRYAQALNTGSDALAYGTALKAAGYMANPNGARDIAAAASSVQIPGYADAGMVNESRKSAEDLEKTIAGTRALTSQALAAKLEEVERQLQQFEVSGRQDTPEYQGLLQREQETRAAQFNLVDPQTAATRDTQRQLDTARLARRYGFTPADDQLAADMSKREDIARTTGSPVTDEVRGQVTSQFYAKANLELERLEKTQQEASKGQETLAAAYARGNAAVADTTAKNEALHAIASVLPKDAANYADALQKLTAGYRQAITDAANIKVGQQLGADRKDMATTAEEMRLVKSGAGPDQTAIDLAGFKARQANDTASPIAQAEAEQSARDKARQQLDLTNLRANSNELTSFADSAADKIGSSLTSAFASGKSAAVSFGGIAKSVLSELEQEFVKLAIINPLKNAISGGNSSLPTLGGVFSGLSGSAFTSTATKSVAAVTRDAGTTGVEIASGALYHFGGIVGSEPTALRAYPANTWAGARRMHTGGVAGLMDDEVPAVLKRGEAVLTPGQMAALGAGMGGPQQAGDTHVHLHINAQGAGPREIDQLKTQIPLIALQSVQSAMSRGGSFAKTVRGA